MSAENGISHDYCNMRSGSLETLQQMSQRRLDSHGKKLDELTVACIRLTAAVERVTLILERQDARLERVERRNLFSFLESQTGKLILRFLGVGLLVLLSAALGINVFQLLKEVL
ncbi:MAG: hypothetical protein IJN82_02880 [Clostridia bacterium]|nr:hypothetical protein [Clostridia bacterium]